MPGGRILIVDDNKNVLKALEILLKFEFEFIHTVSSPKNIISELEQNNYDLVILDMNFEAGVNSGNEGMFWLDRILEFDPSLSVVLITAYGDVELAVSAIKNGATDFVLKPWDNQKLKATIKSAIQLSSTKRKLEKAQNRNEVLKEEVNHSYKPIVGYSDSIMQVLRIVKKVSKTDANVLILGENGTGKELIAKEIHRQSNRSDEIMLSVDIGSLPESLFEDELFGHKKGAFTDAFEDRTGKIESADGGTLFLDEIGNLPLNLQTKLLSVIESRQVVRIGSNKVKDVDIRLISATNKNLEEMVKNGDFREDLLYRINTIVVEVPPLRDRGSDIIVLANFFLNQFKKKYEKPGITISQRGMDALLKYSWPGNVRELLHTMEKAVILSEETVLKTDDFFIRPSPKISSGLPKTIQGMETMMVLNAIDKHNGNMSAAAGELGITRQTLYKKMNKIESQNKTNGK
jgi:DNA-binding NtrC family response regulator